MLSILLFTAKGCTSFPLQLQSNSFHLQIAKYSFSNSKIQLILVPTALRSPDVLTYNLLSNQKQKVHVHKLDTVILNN